MKITVGGSLLQPIAPAPAVAPPNPAWYDLSGQFDLMWYHITEKLHTVAIDFQQSVWDGLDVLLPGAALIGVILYMVPFFPYSNTGPKITGTALLLYLFYSLIRGGA